MPSDVLDFDPAFTRISKFTKSPTLLNTALYLIPPILNLIRNVDGPCYSLLGKAGDGSSFFKLRDCPKHLCSGLEAIILRSAKYYIEVYSNFRYSKFN
jgi:hypothetical protein